MKSGDATWEKVRWMNTTTSASCKVHLHHLRVVRDEGLVRRLFNVVCKTYPNLSHTEYLS
jgi:hypothetical protein